MRTFQTALLRAACLVVALSCCWADGIDETLAKEVVARVTTKVEELRGLEFRSEVPVEVIDDAEARRYLIARLESFGYDRILRDEQVAYRQLGLLPEGADLMQSMLDVMEEQAGGFYDPERGTFYLLSDMPADSASVLVMHELTHALEDQHFDLDRRIKERLEDEDRLFAVGAVHEGSATLLMTRYSTMAVLSGELTLEQLQALEHSDAAQGAVFSTMPAVLQRQLLGPYVLGASFLSKGGGILSAATKYPAERVDRAFADSPDSSEQILHPEKYWEERDPPHRVRLEGVGEVLGEGFEPAATGVLGELTLGVLVGAPTPSIKQAAYTPGAGWTNAAAAGWGGDRWELWREGDRNVTVLLTSWDTPLDAEEFDRALPRETSRRRDGSRVAVVSGDLGKQRKKVLRHLLRAGRIDSPGAVPIK